MKRSFIFGVAGSVFSIVAAFVMLLIVILFGNADSSILERLSQTTDSLLLGGVIVMVGGVVGVAGAVVGRKIGGAAMIAASVMVFLQIMIVGIIPSVLLFLGGVFAFTEKPFQTPNPHVPTMQSYPRCPVCGAPIRYIGDAQRWYCDREGKFV